MRTQSEDTSPEMERVQIELVRKVSPANRLILEPGKKRRDTFVSPLFAWFSISQVKTPASYLLPDSL